MPWREGGWLNRRHPASTRASPRRSMEWAFTTIKYIFDQHFLILQFSIRFLYLYHNINERKYENGNSAAFMLAVTWSWWWTIVLGFKCTSYFSKKQEYWKYFKINKVRSNESRSHPGPLKKNQLSSQSLIYKAWIRHVTCAGLRGEAGNGLPRAGSEVGGECSRIIVVSS